MHINVSYRIDADDGQPGAEAGDGPLRPEHVQVVRTVAANVGGVLEIALGQQGLAARVSEPEVSSARQGAEGESAPPAPAREDSTRPGAEGESAPLPPARGTSPRLAGGTGQD